MAGENFLVNGLGGAKGFGEQTLAVGDDAPIAAVDITSVFGAQGLNFLGTSYTQLFVNNNGNLTIIGGQGGASGTIGGNLPLIAPFWSDVDTEGGTNLPATPGGNSTGSNRVYYDLDTVNDVFTATWDDVGRFNNLTSPLNAFQVQFVRVSGGFDIVFRYEAINWAFQFASAGVAVAAGEFALLPASSSQAEMLLLDTAPGNTGIAGFYQFGVRNGTSGSNTLAGTVGDDFMDGAAGSDTLNGGSGNDTLRGGTGNDTLNGGGGADTASYVSATAAVKVNMASATQITGGAGTDTFSSIENVTGGNFNDGLTGNASNNTLRGGAGNDTLRGSGGNDTLDGGADSDTANYANAAVGVVVNLTLTGAQNTVGAGSDTLIGIENVTGGAGNDTLTGNVFDNTLQGGAGNDTLNGAGGVDTASYASAAAGVKVSLALAGAQNTVGAGSDTLGNIENLTGSAFKDTLTGDGWHNTLQGGAGNDTLNGGDGSDTASYASATAAVKVSLALSGAQKTGGAGTDTLDSIENLIGGAGDDVLTGDASDNTLDGGAGDDTLDGGGGADTMIGGTGDDTYHVNQFDDDVQETSPTGGNDTIIVVGINYSLTGDLEFVENMTFAGDADVGGLGNESDNNLTGNDANNYLNALGGRDRVFGRGGIDGLEGNAADDFLSGGAGNDELWGGTAFDDSGEFDGDDELDGGSGVDKMWGGTGNDIYHVDEAGDMIWEEAPVGLLGLEGDLPLTPAEASELGDIVNAAVSYSLDYAQAAGVENLVLVAGKAAALNATGNALDNLITGNALANQLKGLGGNDYLIGGNGNDILDGGAEADAMAGGLGNDTYVVNTFTDWISEGSGAGTDTVLAGDTYTLGSGLEHLTLTGFAISGTGNASANVLTGNSGENALNGRAGNDVIRGLGEADVLTGGTGADRFDYDAVADSGVLADTFDEITDFKKGEDRIDLSTIDAKEGVSGNNAFTFIGAQQFSNSNASGQLRFDAGSHMLFGSTDADSAAEFSILLTGINSMTGANFIL